MLNSKSLYNKGIIKDKNMITQSQISEISFIGKLDNTKLFYSSLKAINFHDDVNIVLNDAGFKATVEDSKYVQASAYVSKSCFSEYKLLQNDPISVRVNLGVVCDCLSIFSGVECSMQMLYKGQGAPLVFVLEQHGEDNLITECSIKTKNGEEPLDLALNGDEETYNMMILRGPDFAQLLGEIDRSAEELEILMSPKAPYFRLTTLGVVQSESNVEVAKTSDMMDTFSCKARRSTKYRMSHMRIPMRALALGAKVALRSDENGLLGLQVMVMSEDDSQIYIEYFITPLIDDD